MKKSLLIILILSSLLGCQKSGDVTNPTPTPEKYSDKIILKDIEVVGTTSVKLTWSQLENEKFIEYNVFREEDLGSGIAQLNMIRIQNKEQTTYTDTDVPYKSNVRYFITATLQPPTYLSIRSNTRTYSRPTANLLSLTPHDVLYNKDDKLLYLIENSGVISLYDVTTDAVIKTINTGATLGYCDLGVFNGKKELYVSRNDGWVFVYDAVTLDKITQINTGINGSSVVVSKNQLFVSSSNYGQHAPMKVFSRATGAKISETKNAEIRRLKVIPNTETDLLSIESATFQNVYKFDANGALTNTLYQPSYPGSVYINWRAVEVFSDGSKYIASVDGDILNKDMSYSGKLAVTNTTTTYTTFAFNSTQSAIYAGSNNKTIDFYTVPNYNQTKSITASGIPFKLFDFGDQLLCVSIVTRPSLFASGTAVEKLKK